MSRTDYNKDGIISFTEFVKELFKISLHMDESELKEIAIFKDTKNKEVPLKYLS